MTDATHGPAAPITWTVVIPVKGARAAKTRLGPAVADDARAMLARAFALDTIAAALAAGSVARVIVVGDDPELAGEAEFLAEPVDGPRSLGRAIAHGIAQAQAGFERLSRQGGIAVLLGDLPALRSDELDAALEAAARHPLAYVPDAEGTGTTLATAREGVPLDAHFGQDSAARHAAAGFADLAAVHPGAIAAGLRRDVDTAAELREAVALGVGARTSAVLRILPDLAEGSAPRHPLDPSTAPAGADRKAAS